MGWFRNIRAMNRQAKVAVGVSLALEQAAKGTGTNADWDDWSRQFFKAAYTAAPHAFDPSHPLAMKVEMAVFLVLIYAAQGDSQIECPDQIRRVTAKAIENCAVRLLGSDSSLKQEEKKIVRDTIAKLRNESDVVSGLAIARRVS